MGESAPRIDLREDLLVLGIIVTHQLSILYAEPVLPEGEMADGGRLGFFAGAGRGRVGVGDEAALAILATQDVSAAKECTATSAGAGGRLPGRWAGSVGDQ